MGPAARIVIFFVSAVLAGCATPERLRESFAKQGYVSEAALQGGYVNTPFMRYMDQRDAERRVARDIANEFEVRAAQRDAERRVARDIANEFEVRAAQ